MVRHDPHELAARIVQNAGGKVVGRSRMQKVTDLARPAGFPAEFGFACRPHGPFSEDRATGLEIASVFADLLDEVRQSDRGGTFAIDRLAEERPPTDPERRAFR